VVQELSTAAALVTVVKALGGWGTSGVLFVIVWCPLFAAGYMTRIISRSINSQTAAITALQRQVANSEKESEKRALIFTNRYDNNIEFVKNYEKLAGNLTDLVHVNVQAMTRMVEKITANQWCPIVRRKGDPDE